MADKDTKKPITVTATLVRTIPEFQAAALQRAGAIPIHGRLLTEGFATHVVGRPEFDQRPEKDGDDENFDKDGSRKERDERKPKFRVELLCRTFAGDNGIRPLPSMTFWESPDIWIDGPSGDPDIATPGVPNKVNVHVWNLGNADCWAAHVDLYWCDPAVGINAASAMPIGSTVLTLPAGQHSIATFDWTPVLNNDGHECLVAQVYDPISDPIVAPFNPVQDRHVAQRNISVIEIPAGEPMNFAIFTQNLSFSTAATTLEVQRLEGPALDTLALTMGQKAWVATGQKTMLFNAPTDVDPIVQPQPELLATGLFRETLQELPPGGNEARRVSAALQRLVTPDRRSAEDRVGAEPKSSKPRSTVRTAAIDFKRGKDVPRGALALDIPKQRRLRIEIEAAMPAEAKRGSADAYRIVERTGDRITGGVTVIARRS